ncbi:MAG: diacylglycerol/lipid kinase family protein [Burkholderiaceae bacterium]
MPSSNLVRVIVNASSGKGHSAEWAAVLTDKLRRNGIDAEVTLAHGGAGIAEAIRSAVACNPPVIVAGGGDGTMNAVASVLVGTGIALGVLPLGTLNHFAKDLRIPADLDGALRVIAAGLRVRIDVGNVNDRFFVNNSSLGLYPTVVRHRERQQRVLGRGKWPAFVYSALMTLRRCPFLDLRLTIGEQVQKRRAPFVFVGNNEYVIEGFDIGERKTLDGGCLSLYTARHVGRLGLVRLAVQALLGRLRQARDFDMLAVKEVEIETRRTKLDVAIDGEVTTMETPLRYRILRRALIVIAPRSDTP